MNFRLHNIDYYVPNILNEFFLGQVFKEGFDFSSLLETGFEISYFFSEPAYEPYGYSHGPSYGGYPGPSYGQPMGHHGPPAHGPPRSPQGHHGPRDPQGHHGPAPQQGQAQPENQAGSE